MYVFHYMLQLVTLFPKTSIRRTKLVGGLMSEEELVTCGTHQSPIGSGKLLSPECLSEQNDYRLYHSYP